MVCFACPLILLLSATSNSGNTVPVKVTGDWNITVECVTGPVVLTVDVPDEVAVSGERHDKVPVWDSNGFAVFRGVRLEQLATAECTAAGTYRDGTLRVRLAEGNAPPLAEGRDYAFDPFWGRFGRLEGGAISAEDSVLVDYAYCKQRLDSIVCDGAGKAKVHRGQPGMGVVKPAEPSPGETVVANVWVSGPMNRLTDENIFPVEANLASAMPAHSDVAEKLLPNTLCKLRSGEPLTLVAWGDSVTDMRMYQHQFADRLKERFPKANINLLTAAWGGRGSRDYLEAPAGGEKDFERDVITPKPDVVVMEWVNDAYLDEKGVSSHYGGILSRLRGAGAEVIILTPHLVRPDWMGMTTLKYDDDPRPYVRGLRDFSVKNKVALADSSRLWCQTWRRGLPYITILENSINHPDKRGHALFADALMGLFPMR